MGDDEAALFELLDGQHALPELIPTAETRFGPGGATRLARLLADLGRARAAGGRRRGRRGGRRPAARDGSSSRASSRSPALGRLFERVYRRGGWVLFTRAGLVAVVALVVAGISAFAYLIARR